MLVCTATKMKTTPSKYDVPFEKLIDLFKRKSNHDFILKPLAGEGYVQVINLEKGLQTRFWDCHFNESINLYNDAGTGIENTYFTLAFFLNMQGLQFTNRDTSLQKNLIWDTVFISATSNYRIHLSPMAKLHCLSISFSKRWLCNNVLENNGTFKDLKEKIYATESFSLLESMTSSEKKVILELFDARWKKCFGSFYVKTGVLKMISDFFYKIKGRETLAINNPDPDTSIAEVEKYLTDHLTGKLPNLKDLAQRFSLSESTLKRHFKKKHGVTMSQYFIHKKMEYARQLMHEKNTDIAETATMLGYRNVSYFITTFQKHFGSLPR